MAYGYDHILFSDQVFERSGNLAASDGRDDAIGARVIAPRLNRHPCCPGHFANGIQGWGHFCGGLWVRGIENLELRTFLYRTAKQRWRRGKIVCPHHNIDVSCAFLDPTTIFLGETTSHRNLESGLLALDGGEMAQVAVELVISVLSDTAGIEDHHIGVFEFRGGLQAIGNEHPGEPLGIVLIHLAPEGTDEKLFRHAPKSTTASGWSVAVALSPSSSFLAHHQASMVGVQRQSRSGDPGRLHGREGLLADLIGGSRTADS